MTGRTKKGRWVGTRRSLRLPLTSMIDVTFLLLLYFLLTTTFRQAEGQIPGDLPKTDGRRIARPILIHLRAVGPGGAGVLYEMSGIDDSIRSPKGLYAKLTARRQQWGSTEVPVVITGRSDVRWQYVVEAFNQAVRAGFAKVGIDPGTPGAPG